VVGPTLYRYLRRLDIPVELYAPFDTPAEQLQLGFLEHSPKESQFPGTRDRPMRMEPAWVALVDILARIEQEPYHWPVGRTTFQKIAYFATEAGIPTGLQYAKGSFGPYASEVKRLVTKLVNNGLIREEQMGQMFGVKVGPTFEDARKAYQRELDQWSQTLESLADLFMRVRTNQAEVAATVHFAAKTLEERKHEKPTELEVLREVMEWKQRRRPPLNEAEVALAIRNLSRLGWLRLRPSVDLPLSKEALLDV
jgi:uncharacterized protein YwgA